MGLRGGNAAALKRLQVTLAGAVKTFCVTPHSSDCEKLCLKSSAAHVQAPLQRTAEVPKANTSSKFELTSGTKANVCSPNGSFAS